MVSSPTNQDDGTLMCKTCRWNKSGICTKMVNPDSLKHPTIMEARAPHKEEPCNVFVEASLIGQLINKTKPYTTIILQGLIPLLGAFLILTLWVCITFIFESL